MILTLRLSIFRDEYRLVESTYAALSLRRCSGECRQSIASSLLHRGFAFDPGRLKRRNGRKIVFQDRIDMRRHRAAERLGVLLLPGQAQTESIQGIQVRDLASPL
ncbi:hypothetical protein KC341_g54 [Hortaea werneckii]|nr:hypothetical protein KC341_g54 [Hortaea werneckii]